MRTCLLPCICLLTAAVACTRTEAPQANCDAPRLVSLKGGYPYVTEYNGTFYYLMQHPPANSINIFTSRCIDSISDRNGSLLLVGDSLGMKNIWAPELHRIDGKWYIYFEADDGNTDNHQLFVIENSTDNPLEGEWTLHGPIITGDECNFGIHPSSLVADGRQYLLWSGWQQQRVETETQCIFIAEMENPWTPKSERILISRPEYEWERQWVNRDGSRTAYPIFVNENPAPFVSPDGRNICVAYSASGIWTPYSTLGLLYAKAGSDLLDPASWTKMEEPVFPMDINNFDEAYGASNVWVITPSDGSDSRILYEVKECTDNWQSSHVYMKTIGWDENSLPVFGSPR